MTTEQASYQTDLQPQKYALPSRGLIRPRQPFSLELLPDEEWLSYRRVSFLASFFPIEAGLWITNHRIIVMANRWVKMPIVYEIPRTCIKSLEWQSDNYAGWIDVNYENAGEQGRIQLSTNRYTSQKKGVADNEALLSQLQEMFHGNHKHHQHKSETIAERPNRLDIFSKTIILLGVIGCFCLIPYLAFQYYDAKQVLQAFNSSAGCSAPGVVEKAVSYPGACEVSTEKILRLYTTQYKHTTNYLVVVEGQTRHITTVRLLAGETFYQTALVGDMIQVQRFNDKIAKVIDGAASAVTQYHPERQVRNVVGGLWVTGIFVLFGIFTILSIRRNLGW